MARLAVTGGSGFIGRHLLAASAPAHDLFSLDRDALRSQPALPRGIDAVIHLAGRAHVLREQAEDPDAAFLEANLELTLRLARAALRAGARRFVFVSSAGVLGASSPPGGLHDDSLPRPYDAYTRSKLAAERALLDLWRLEGLPLVILRPPLVYGPGAAGNFRRMERGIRSGIPLPIGALRAPRSMIGLRNLVSALLAAALKPEAVGATMLVADAGSVSIRDLGREMAQAMGRPARQMAIPVRMLAGALRLAGREADVARLTTPFELLTSRVSERLGWAPPHARAEELAWTYGRAERVS